MECSDSEDNHIKIMCQKSTCSSSTCFSKCTLSVSLNMHVFAFVIFVFSSFCSLRLLSYISFHSLYIVLLRFSSCFILLC